MWLCGYVNLVFHVCISETKQVAVARVSSGGILDANLLLEVR